MKKGRFSPALLGASVLLAIPLAAYSDGAFNPSAPLSNGVPQAEELAAQIKQLEARNLRGQSKLSEADKNRLKIAQTLQSAESLVNEQKYSQALAKLDEIGSMPGKTPEDAYIAERTRVVIAAKTNDEALLIRSLEATLATNLVPAGEKKDFDEQLAQSYYRQKDYAKASAHAQRYFAEGGSDSQMRLLLARSAFLNKDFSLAKDESKNAIQDALQSNAAPSEEELRVYAASATNLNDRAGYTQAMEWFATYYPKPEYWADLLNQRVSRPDFPERLTLDVYRLMQATGQLNTAKDYADMADVTMKNGYAVEAKSVLDKGFQSGLLGSGPDAAKQRQLRDQAARSAAADLSEMAKLEKSFIKEDKANQLANMGYMYVVDGKTDEGLSLMEKAIASGKLKSPEDVKLHLGVAYAIAHRNDDAVKTFKSVQGSNALNDLARYWTIYLEHPLQNR